MIDLNNYYLGIIIADMTYFNNKKRYRMIGDVSYDPFDGHPFPVATISGIPTLLRKENDIYYDEHFSRFKNELSYKLNEANNLGIILAYAKPFLEFFDENDAYFIKEDVENDPKINEFIFNNFEYYISHSKLNKSDAVVIIDNMPMLDFHMSYYDYLKEKFDEKKLIK